MILLLLALPVVASAFALVAPPRVARFTNAGLLAITAVLAAILARRVLASGTAETAAAGWLRADGLATLVALTVAVSAAIGAAVGARSFTSTRPQVVRAFTTLFPFLAAALLVAALSDHLGLLWIALELAAVLSAFLIGSGGGREQHEAAFKYMLLGSAGLVMALLATVIAYYAGRPTLGHGDAALSFVQLRETFVGSTSAAQPMRIALALAAAGYGLKVGLFPLHVWKPDAYAAAPGPVAALLAGGAVLVPLEALLRFGELTAAAGEGAFVRELFQTGGAVSMIAALLLMVRERDIRRILAYTSVEHLGLILLACGTGAASAQGGLLHLIGNGILKALAFAVVGLVVTERGTGDTQTGPGLYRHSLGLSAIFLVIIAAGLGFPPFAMFTSEITVLGALFSGGHYLVGILVLIALAAIFGVVASASLRLVFARADEAEPPRERHGRAAIAVALPVLALAAWLGVASPWWLWHRLAEIGGRIAP